MSIKVREGGEWVEVSEGVNGSDGGGGQTVSQYMRPAYRWLGWGIKGYRQQYAYDYSKRLVLQ
jgi:hypothetical protein